MSAKQPVSSSLKHNLILVVLIYLIIVGWTYHIVFVQPYCSILFSLLLFCFIKKNDNSLLFVIIYWWSNSHKRTYKLFYILNCFLCFKVINNVWFVGLILLYFLFDYITHNHLMFSKFHEGNIYNKRKVYVMP